MSDPRILLQPGPDGRLTWALDLPEDIAPDRAVEVAQRAGAIRQHVAAALDNSPPTEKQLGLLRHLLSEAGRDLAAEAQARYDCKPADLRRKDVSEWIDELRGNPTPGTPVERPASDPPTGPATPRPGTPASEKQVNAIFAMGRAGKHWSDTEIAAQVAYHYGCPVAQLTKTEASQYLDFLAGKLDETALPVADASADEPPPAEPPAPDVTWEDLGDDSRPAADKAAEARAAIERGFAALEWGPAQRQNWLRTLFNVDTVGRIPADKLDNAVRDLAAKYRKAQAQTNGKVATHAAH